MSLRDQIKVMIVDDMTVSRGLLTQALDDIGIKNYDTTKAGDDALSRLAANPAHLVISDFNMPRMNGLQLLESLRKNAATRSIGFILVTGSPSAEIIEKGRSLGMNNMITKPFTSQQIKGVIEAVVGRL